MIIHITLLIIPVVISEEMTCSLDKCTNPIKMKVKGVETESALHVDAKVVVESVKRHGPSTMIKVSRYTAHCSEVPFNNYDECNGAITTVPLSEKEALETLKSGQCSVGIECIEDGQCWGSEAANCLSSVRNKKMYPGPIPHGVRNWYKFPFHTCTQRWGCEITPFTANFKLNEGYSVESDTPIGEKIKFKTTDKVVTTKLNYTIIPNIWNGVYTKTAKAKCIIQSLKSVCLIQTSDPFLIEFDRTGQAYLRDIHVKLLNHGELINMHDDGLNNVSGSSPLSIDQARVIRSSLMYANLQAHLNSKIIEGGLNALYKMVFRLISYLAMHHPTLVRSILNIPGSTIYSNSEAFLQCPCNGEGTSPCVKDPTKKYWKEKDICNIGTNLTHYKSVDFSWSGDFDWNAIPNIHFYSTAEYDQLIKELQDKHRDGIMNEADAIEENNRVLLGVKSYVDNFFKSYSHIASWVSLIISLWLLHVYTVNLFRTGAYNR